MKSKELAVVKLCGRSSVIEMSVRAKLHTFQRRVGQSMPRNPCNVGNVSDLPERNTVNKSLKRQPK
jgi:hypothetical protein